MRTKNKLSQEQLALRAEIAPAYLGQIERGEKNPTVVTIERICAALGICLSDFFSNQSFPDAEEDAVLNQILFELRECSVAEKQEILQIIKHALKLKQV